MGNPIVVLGQHEIDMIKAMPRKELNAECLHLMREQMELTQQLHELRKRIGILEKLRKAVIYRRKVPTMYHGVFTDRRFKFHDMARLVQMEVDADIDAILAELEVRHGVIDEPRQETD